jgi:hypothetical protein
MLKDGCNNQWENKDVVQKEMSEVVVKKNRRMIM